ncbi:ABC transporter ATP-binding protein [Mollicutes bacterium LVI A0039]|nr:ABC transporter ATP-binding protein [Mollicutes bacterium LVI A0039]
MKEIISRYKGRISLIAFISIVTTACMLYQPTVISDVIAALNNVNDLGEIEPDQQAIITNGTILVVLGIISLITGVATGILSSDLAQVIGTDIREEAYKNVQRFSSSDVEKFSSSKLVVRLTNDVTQIQNFIVMGAQMIMRVPIMFVGAFILAVMDFPQLWWTIILYILIVGVIMAISMKRMGPLFGGMQKDLDRVNTILKENMLGIRVVKSFVTEEKEQKRFTEEVENLNEKQMAVAGTFSFMVPAFMFTANILTAVAIYLTAGWAIDDPALIGSLISFTTYVMQIMFAVIMMGMLSMTISRASVSGKRISEVLDYKPSMSFGKAELETIKSVEFKNVNFAYSDSDENVLEDISFTINHGEKIGIVGLTGCGKSTLVQLLPRLYDTTAGEIIINNRSINEYSNSSLRNKIGYVLQKPTLFSGTIAENIRQGKADATTEEMIEAAKAAQAFEFINSKDDKFEARVEQMGNNFSGGQKQRLAITRGLVKKPDLLILDDSTSALDARSERLVKEAINQLDTTVVMVAQKITSVIDMDRIIVLNDGKIDGIGTHRELRKTSDLYNEIYRTQKGKEQ